jgi:hypothetical protein
LSFVWACALFLSPLATAQTVNADYDRNSLTILSVHHGDNLDSVLDRYLLQNNPGGDKFDPTRIVTKAVTDRTPRYQYDEKGGFNQETSYQNAHSLPIVEQLTSEKVVSQIIGTWFHRSEKGLMDLSVIKARSEYNATDATVNLANAQALGKYLLQGEGVNLIGNSYILVVDHSRPKYEYSRDSYGNTSGIRYTADALGYLYKVVFSDADRQRVYDCWIYPEDSAAERNRKNEAWSRIPFAFTSVMNVHATGSSSKTFTDRDRGTDGLEQKCIEDCVTAILSKLEDKVEGWMVKSAIYSTHPVTSKIGTKEGLRRMDRYEVEEFLLDDAGNVTTRRKGYVRATKVNSNTTASTGRTGLSEFYQIAGGRLEPGMLLKQKRDIALSAKALYIGGASSGYGLEFDLPFYMNTSGSAPHVIIGGSYKGFDIDVSAIDVRMGLGYGVRPIRQLEIIPTVSILADILAPKGDTNSSVTKNACWCAEPGVALDLTLFYPVKLTGGVYYDIPVMGSETWVYYRDQLSAAGIPDRAKGLTWKAGLCVEF